MEVCPACGGRIVLEGDLPSKAAPVEASVSDQKLLNEGLGAMALIPWISLIFTLFMTGRLAIANGYRVLEMTAGDRPLISWSYCVDAVLMIGLFGFAFNLLVYRLFHRSGFIQKLRNFFLILGCVNVGRLLLMFVVLSLEPGLMEEISLSGLARDCFYPFFWFWVLKRIRDQA